MAKEKGCRKYQSPRRWRRDPRKSIIINSISGIVNSNILGWSILLCSNRPNPLFLPPQRILQAKSHSVFFDLGEIARGWWLMGKKTGNRKIQQRGDKKEMKARKRKPRRKVKSIEQWKKKTFKSGCLRKRRGNWRVRSLVFKSEPLIV